MLSDWLSTCREEAGIRHIPVKIADIGELFGVIETGTVGNNGD
jgi:hypothetical protein